MLWIGLDEAGYGPPLGPLVIGATVWRIPDEIIFGKKKPGQESDSYRSLRKPAGCLYRILRNAIVKKILRDEQHADHSRRPVMVADSKIVYGVHGITELERTALALIRCSSRLGSMKKLKEKDSKLRKSEEYDIFRRLCENHLIGEFLDGQHPWEWNHEFPLPHAATPADLVDQVWFTEKLSAKNVELLAACGRVVFPKEFNSLLDRCENNKSNVLFQVTMDLLQCCLQLYPNESVWIDADKQGARDRYAAMLQNHFDVDWINIMRESNEESLYHWVKTNTSECDSSDAKMAQRWIRFRVNGERSMPTAAASCVAKYVRQLAMHAWNSHWCSEVADLRPTAGYYGDAKRFYERIQPLLLKRGVSDNEIVRRK